MKITAIIQARMTSTRLPGKILMQVAGKPLLQIMIERVLKAKHIDSVVLATTTNKEDDPTAELGRELGVAVFRGDENDVLKRYYGAASEHKCKHVMRLTGDCPVIDPDMLDILADFYFQGGYDYASNCLEATLPDGLDAEIISMEALTEAYKKAELPSQREHVTLYVKDNPDNFKMGSWKNSADYSHMRWTVDDPEDFTFIKKVIEALLPVNPDFRMQDVVDLVEETPELLQINAHINRDEGLAKSLAEEAELRAGAGDEN
ncbi:cytidylyltransferase domain-containing protein [Maridesulfovibrio sp.]|uniref:cytidylyltransferase domain-containing protein n=1 Tax=Maridesulfovibrio sp. TaxID=2795000 RepID=UPI003BAAC043